MCVRAWRKISQNPRAARTRDSFQADRSPMSRSGQTRKNWGRENLVRDARETGVRN
jgi:hypothetical protein